MQGNASKKLGKGWDRHQVTFRLSSDRMIELMAIASAMPEGATPTDAICRAIELARSSTLFDCSDAVDAVHSVDASLAANFAELLEAQNWQGKAIAYLQSDLSKIKNLLSAAAMAGDPDEMGFQVQQAQPEPFSAWLCAAIAKSGYSATRSAIASGSLQSISLVSEKLARIELFAELAAIDSKKAPASTPSRSMLELVELSNPLLRTPLGDPLFFVAQPKAGGWTLHIHRATEGQASQSITVISV